MKPRLHALMPALMAIFVIAACDGGQSASAATYKFGITPWQKGQTEDDITYHYRPMLDYLTERTGDEFIIVSARDYKQMIHFLADGEVDFCSISPAPYVLAKKLNSQVQLVVTELTWDKTSKELTDSYLGFFVTLKSRDDINGLEDLKGKRFGFVKEESSSGFKYPNARLREHDLDYHTFFGRHYFLGSHPRVTDAVAAGSIDAGATWDFNLRQAQDKHGDIFKIVVTTPPIPNLCIAAHSRISAATIAAMQQALVNINPELLWGLPAAGFIVRPDAFYDVVRQIALEN